MTSIIFVSVQRVTRTCSGSIPSTKYITYWGIKMLCSKGGELPLLAELEESVNCIAQTSKTVWKGWSTQCFFLRIMYMNNHSMCNAGLHSWTPPHHPLRPQSGMWKGFTLLTNPCIHVSVVVGARWDLQVWTMHFSLASRCKEPAASQYCFFPQNANLQPQVERFLILLFLILPYLCLILYLSFTIAVLSILFHSSSAFYF